jgi:hypothetical protein
MVDNMKSIGINPDGLFINADLGFDNASFKKACESNDIIANINFNKRNSKTTDNEHLLDNKLYKERFLLNAQMHGSILLKSY